MRAVLTQLRTGLVGAIIVAAALTAMGMGPIPSSSVRSATCTRSSEDGCCACYVEDGHYRCHAGAQNGSEYCDGGEKYCAPRHCTWGVQ